MPTSMARSPTFTTAICSRGPTDSVAAIDIRPLARPAGSCERRFTSHSTSGMDSTTSSSTPKEVSAADIDDIRQPRFRRRMRSAGVTMSVRRMPKRSLTTTTSPCAIR